MAATVGVLNGTNLLVYVATSAISYSTSCSLTITGAGTINVNNKDSGYWTAKLKAHGTTWSVSCDGMLGLDGAGTSIRELHDILEAKTTVTVKFASTSADDYFFTGSAVCTSFSADAGDNAAGTFSCEFEGLGVLRCTLT